jgi:dTDP-4-amino-4,6-dideoxy-D-glucose ammonia-lyase
MKLYWHDVLVENRSGLPKRPDLTTNVASDLIAHLLSIATVLAGRKSVHITDVRTADGGVSVDVDLMLGEIPVELSFTRDAQQTRREAIVHVGDGFATLDFATEPGQVAINQKAQPTDPNWDLNYRPLNAEAAHLFGLMNSDDNRKKHELGVRQNLNIIEANVDVERRIEEIQYADLKRDLHSEAEKLTAIHSLRQHLAAPLFDHGVIDDPKNHEAIDNEVNLAFQIIKTMANRPFSTQRSIAERLGISLEHQIRLNKAIRNSPFAQRVIRSAGLGTKYLANTIIPIIQSGSIHRSFHGTQGYPYRVGVYTGKSCMFHCTFCGRDPDAKYSGADVDPGNELLKQVFRDAPRDDPNRFYLSGGLEPLTNPGLGDIIQCGAAEGFRLSLYTNGFMLTPKLIDKQPGLWDLGSLRISLYGVNKETAEAVTLKPRSFEQVIKNAESFLKMRNERESELQFGFNFVLLRGKTDQLMPLANLLAEINRSAGGRQIDFLTLREDYSVSAEDGISEAERDEMVRTIREFEDRLKQDDLCDLKVDYGYSLQALKEGYVGTPLEMVTHDEMWASAYPQTSVVVDLLGDVYAYREAGFLNRPGADRYIMGRMTSEVGLEDIVRNFVDANGSFEARPGDTCYFDIFDHVVTKVIRQMENDELFGVPFEDGPVAGREPMRKTATQFTNAHFADASV